ncbi:MAG TPA: flavodoxin domain-containing protein [bacterium]|nr:flavodoxin domain-containing protein [bacterium]
MKKILVVYYSRSGNTKKLAEAIVEGAQTIEDVEVTLKSVEQVTNDDLVATDALIAGSPVYYGSMAAPVVDMFAKSVAVRKKMENKLGAAFATSGHHTGGKETTITGILQAMLISGMIVLGDPLKSGGHYGVGCVGSPDEEALTSAQALGSRVASLLTGRTTLGTSR